MRSEFKHINTAFEASVIKKRDDLQYLVNKGNVSQGFINRQNQILRNIIEYQQFTHSYIDYLENELAKVRVERREKVQELHDRIISFEAICILHGIMDFPYWLSKTKPILINEAVEAQHKYGIRLPCQWKEKIEDLPDKERKTLKQILFKKERTEVKKLLKELSQKRKTILSKIGVFPEPIQNQIQSLLKL